MEIFNSLSQVKACPGNTPEIITVPPNVAWAELLRTDPTEALAKRADFENSPGGGKYGIAVFLARGGYEIYERPEGKTRRHPEGVTIQELDVHPEGQMILEIFNNRWCPFNKPEGHAHATADSITQAVASFENVVIVHFAGHTIDGQLALEGRNVSTEFRRHFGKAICNDSIVTLLTAKGTVQLVLPEP